MVSVRGFDESCNFRGCEIVGWVSEKSGCLLSPGKNDKHKFTWVYLGSLLDRLLLTANVSIYLCLVYLFILGILRMTCFYLVLD